VQTGRQPIIYGNPVETSQPNYHNPRGSPGRRDVSEARRNGPNSKGPGGGRDVPPFR